MTPLRCKFLTGSNHKMYKTAAQTATYLKELNASVADLDADYLHLFILPPFTALLDAVQETTGTGVQTGVLRDVLRDLYRGSDSQIPVLYGGSIDARYAPALLEQSLVGGRLGMH